MKDLVAFDRAVCPERSIVLSSFPRKAMRIGVFLPNWIGDVIMATPTVRALRRQLGPDDKLIGIMRPYVADVLED
jgi:hypothetical protein